MDNTEKQKHAFIATRKDTPKGEASDWWKYCDVCGGRVNDPIHDDVPQKQQDQTLLDAIEGRTG